MKRARPDFLAEHRYRMVRAAAAVVVLFTAGCASTPVAPYLETPGYYRPSNVYIYSMTLPAALRRVALLPVTTASGDASQQAGVEALEPVVASELGKTKRFEVVALSGEQLQQLTGKAAWRADEMLPMDFFDRLQKATGSDAVMFCQLTKYQAYPPLATGWKLTLASKATAASKQAQILWSVDDVLDAGEPKVEKAARTYYSQHVHPEQPAGDPVTILRSPSLFGQFGLSALFETLPDREAN